jgi:hypothetical protein
MNAKLNPKGTRMNHSSHSDRVRRLATTATGFVITAIGIFVAAPSAFARFVPPGGTSSTGFELRGEVPSVAASLPAHHSGTSGWEVALIVVGAVVVIGLSVLATVRHRQAAKRVETALAGRNAASTDSLSRAGG